MTDANAPVSVVFVCWGNICRSPMAERIARAQASAKHHDGIVFTSAGVSSEETGNPIDPRARAVLTRHGYDASGHRAHRITAAKIADADLKTADKLIMPKEYSQLPGFKR